MYQIRRIYMMEDAGCFAGPKTRALQRRLLEELKEGAEGNEKSNAVTADERQNG